MGNACPTLPVHTKRTKCRLYNIFRCSPREVVIHNAGRNVATIGVDRASLGLGVGSRTRLVGSRVGGLSPPFCSPKHTDGERPVLRVPTVTWPIPFRTAIVRHTVYISVPDVRILGRSRMTSVNLSVLDPLRMDHRLVWATTSTTYESWVAAGKPCLRQSCGHDRGSHIPSEGMECSECDCLGFVGSAHRDDSGATPAIRSPRYPKRRRRTFADAQLRTFADAQLGVSSPADPNPLAPSRKCLDHDRHRC